MSNEDLAAHLSTGEVSYAMCREAAKRLRQLDEQTPEVDKRVVATRWLRLELVDHPSWKLEGLRETALELAIKTGIIGCENILSYADKFQSYLLNGRTDANQGR